MDHECRGRLTLVSILGLLLIPLLVFAARAGFQHWMPVGDTAVIGLRVAEVGTGHTPLVGPYSHFGWSHPGPLLFYVLAVPYRLVGGTSAGLLLGALVIDALALFVIVRTLLRLGGLALTAAGLVCFGFTMWTLGASWLWYPWNPNAALLPFAAFLVVAWSVAMGRAWDLPWLVALGSFLVQTHVAYGLIVVGVTVFALGVRWRGRRSESGSDVGTPDPQPRPFVVSGLLLVVLWLPPAIDAIAHAGGNLRDLVDFWLGGHSTIGFAHAVKLMALALSVRGPWLGFPDPPSFGAGVVPQGFPIPVGLVALLGAVLIARHRRDRAATVFCLVVLVAIGLGVVSLWRIVGAPYDYLVYWTRVVAATAWLAAGWTVVRAIPGSIGAKVREGGRVVVIAAGFGLLVLWAWSASTAGVGPSAERASSRELARIVPTVVRAVNPRATVRFESHPTFYGGTYTAGLMFALLQDGITVRATPAYRVPLGSHYTAADASALKLIVASGSAEIRARRASGARMIAESGPTVAIPPGVPAQTSREGVFTYLARVRRLLTPRQYRQFIAASRPNTPVAVFASHRPGS